MCLVAGTGVAFLLSSLTLRPALLCGTTGSARTQCNCLACAQPPSKPGLLEARLVPYSGIILQTFVSAPDPVLRGGVALPGPVLTAETVTAQRLECGDWKTRGAGSSPEGHQQ